MVGKSFARMLTLSVLMFAADPLIAAEPVKSGPQVGDKAAGPFKPLNVNGADAGKEECLYCKNGRKPSIMIFARDLSPSTVLLIRKVEAAAQANAAADLQCCVIVLSDSKDLASQLGRWVASEKIQSTILATYASAGPEKYAIAPDAAVTVLMYSKFVVKANHSYRTGELNDAAIGAVMADLPKILP